MAFRSKRGRPKAERPKTDIGTPELQHKRALGLTIEALDVIHRAEIISDGQHWAGMHLRWLYTLRYGIPTVRSLDLSRISGANSDDRDPVWMAAREAEYRDALAVLDAARARKPVVNVCIFNMLPRTMLMARCGKLNVSAAHKDASALVAGLELLDRNWQMFDREKKRVKGA